MTLGSDNVSFHRIECVVRKGLKKAESEQRANWLFQSYLFACSFIWVQDQTQGFSQALHALHHWGMGQSLTFSRQYLAVVQAESKLKILLLQCPNVGTTCLHAWLRIIYFVHIKAEGIPLCELKKKKSHKQLSFSYWCGMWRLVIPFFALPGWAWCWVDPGQCLPALLFITPQGDDIWKGPLGSDSV